MKKILSVLITSTTLTTAAFSNAGPAPMPAPCPECPATPVPCWGGFKLGAQLGYGHSNSKSNFTADAANTHTGSLKTSAKGALGGFHAAWDLQFDRMWLVGVNASFDFSGLNGKATVQEDATTIIRHNVKSQYTVAVVPRIGMVMKDSLFYVGLGWAGSSWKTHTSISNNTLRRHNSEFLNAVRFSVGAAQKMKNFLLGVEVNYDAYESISSRADNGGAASFRTSHKPRVLSGMVKLSYMLCNKAN